MFVKPAPDPNRPGEVLIVRDPLHMTPIPREGRNLPDITYWHQRLRDGDIVLADPPPAEAPVLPSVHPDDAATAISPGTGPAKE